MNILIGIAIFCVYFILDAAWVYYTWHAQAMHPFRASLASAIIYILSAAAVLIYVENPIYLISGFFGSFFGTFAIIMYQKYKKQ